MLLEKKKHSFGIFVEKNQSLFKARSAEIYYSLSLLAFLDILVG